MLASRLPIRRLIECSFAATLFVPAILRPKLIDVGGKRGRTVSGGWSLRSRIAFFHPSVLGGDTGEKES
jgi:hypothetical protein